VDLAVKKSTGIQQELMKKTLKAIETMDVPYIKYYNIPGILL
jgi:hypothetical protein